MHRLWILCEELNSSQPLEKTSDEEIIAALFDAPQFLDPKFYGYLRRERMSAIAQYQTLFYEGKTPDCIKKIREKL